MTIAFPTNPATGDIFTSDGKSWCYEYGKGWELHFIPVADFNIALEAKQNKLNFSETRPETAEEGDEWVDTGSTGGLKKYTFYSGQWIELGPAWFSAASGDVPPGTTPETGGRLIEVRKSTQRQFAAVPVTLGDVEQWRTVFVIAAENVKAGETFIINFENQVTTELSYNVELVHAIEVRRWIMTNPDTGASYNGGTEPLDDGSTVSVLHGPITGHNISSSGVHHQDAQRSWIFTAEQNYPVLYVCGRVRARSDAATTGAQLSIDEGQGALWYQRFYPLG